MKKNKLIIILGLFDIFSYIITEILLTGNFIEDIYSFNILSVFGIIVFALNLLGLWYAYKNKYNNVVLIAILFAVIYGLYQAISINAIGYRFAMIFDGVIIAIKSNRNNN